MKKKDAKLLLWLLVFIHFGMGTGHKKSPRPNSGAYRE